MSPRNSQSDPKMLAAKRAAVLAPQKAQRGTWLRARRSELGISQAQLAERLGLNRRTLLRWEREDELPLWASAALVGVGLLEAK